MTRGATRKVLFWTTVVLLGAVSVHAKAQRSVDAHLFRPALFSGGIFSVDRAAPSTKYQPGFKFFFNHESTPLRLTFPQQTCPSSGCYGEQKILDNAQVFNLQAQFAIARWLELALDIPLVRQSFVSNPAQDSYEGLEILTRNDLHTNISTPNVSPLDFRIGIKSNLLSVKGFGLAVAVDSTIPFGDEEFFAGDDSFTLHPQLLAGFDRGPLAVAFNMGYRIRRQTTVLWDDPDTPNEAALPLLNVDDELTFGVGALYRFHRIIGIGVEAFGVVPVTSGTYDITSRKIEYKDAKSCPAGQAVPCEIVSTRQVDLPGSVVTEVLGGVIISPMAGVDIAVGAGAGVTGDERRVALRIFGGISWLPGAKTPTVGAEDRDKDGIPDAKDKCPGQAEDKDGFQDEDGCPESDNDGDGIPDSQDKCPSESEDTDGFEDGDGCPDRDNDGDGIPDVKDSCPDKAEDKDKFQDGDGCPDADNDGDNIADAKDSCPDEAEIVNGYQDEDGCPDSAPTGVAIGKGKIEIPEQVRFKRGSAVVDPVSYALLDKIAKKIQSNPQVGKIRIEGHCDNTGTPQKNQSLSQERAEAVMSYLVRKGVAAARIQAIGYGAKRPIAPNTTKAGQLKNRRVEFIVIQVKEGAQP